MLGLWLFRKRPILGVPWRSCCLNSAPVMMMCAPQVLEIGSREYRTGAAGGEE